MWSNRGSSVVFPNFTDNFIIWGCFQGGYLILNSSKNPLQTENKKKTNMFLGFIWSRGGLTLKGERGVLVHPCLLSPSETKY